MRHGLAAGLLGLCLSVPAAAQAPASPVYMDYATAPHLNLLSLESLRHLVPHAARTFSNSLVWQQQRFGWSPSSPITVVLKDFTDYGNASATVSPRNKLGFDVAPFSHSFETFPASERLYSLMNHELVHIAQGDVGGAQEQFWRGLFRGKVAPDPTHPESLLWYYLTVPRDAAPRWFFEGTAVFMETWMAGGLGRAQGGYDEMVFRAMVRDGAEFFDPLGLASRGVKIDFQVGVNAYLYGTRFVTWLALHYSPEHVVRWIRRDPGSQRYYADQFEHVFGLPLEQAWQDWIRFEQRFQQENLAEVRKHAVTEHRNLSSQPLGSSSRMFYDEVRNEIYSAIRSPGEIEFIGALNLKTGQLRKITEIRGGLLYRVASFAFDPASRTAFFTNDNGAMRDLMAVNVDTGEVRTLIEDARIGELVVHPVSRSLYGVRHANAMATLVRIPAPYTEWQEVHAFPYEMVPFDLDLSPGGTLISASISEVDGNQFLRVWDLEKLLGGNAQPLSEFKFGQSVPEGFSFSPDGKYLFGSSYYTGVSNLFRYEVVSGKIDAVSNAESGYFSPVPLRDGKVLALNYTAKGFVPVMIEPRVLSDVSSIRFLGTEVTRKHDSVTRWQVPPPSTANLDALQSHGPYLPLAQIGLANAYPVLQGYKDAAGLGYRFNFSDPAGYARIALTAAYTPDKSLGTGEQGHVSLTGSYLGWRGELAVNPSDFYDLFGPTKRARKGLLGKVGFRDLLIYDTPRRLDLDYELAVRDGIDTLPDAQNVASPISSTTTATVSLRYSNLRKSLGAIEPEQGTRWEIGASLTQAGGQQVPQWTGSAAWGWPLGTRHASAWLHLAAGGGTGPTTNPFSRFYFGGFGNNYVDFREPKRYHNNESLPGFEINEIAARSFARGMLEANLPPLIFESAGVPAFYANWLRPSVFAARLVTDPLHGDRRVHHDSIGAQCDVRFSVLHWSEVTLSVGYARGIRDGRRAGSEWMVSLRLL